jgi:hypothetical protein
MLRGAHSFADNARHDAFTTRVAVNPNAAAQECVGVPRPHARTFAALFVDDRFTRPRVNPYDDSTLHGHGAEQSSETLQLSDEGTRPASILFSKALAVLKGAWRTGVSQLMHSCGRHGYCVISSSLLQILLRK